MNRKKLYRLLLLGLLSAALSMPIVQVAANQSAGSAHQSAAYPATSDQVAAHALDPDPGGSGGGGGG